MPNGTLVTVSPIVVTTNWEGIPKVITTTKPIVTVRREYRDRIDDPPRTDETEFASRFDAIDYARRMYHEGVADCVECVDNGCAFFTARRCQFNFAD